MTPAHPPGWYPDPWGSPAERWFDGRTWTPHLRTRPHLRTGPRSQGRAVLLTVVALVLVVAVAALTTVLVARAVQDVHGGLRDVVCGESPHVCE